MLTDEASEQGRLADILREVVALAREYYELTDRPLGVTGEVGEVLAADALGLKLAPPRTSGYDAVSADGKVRYQVKTRVMTEKWRSQRTSKFNTDAPFDAVLLVLLAKDFGLKQIHEATRDDVVKRLAVSGSKARERGTLRVSEFIARARQVWPREVAESEKRHPVPLSSSGGTSLGGFWACGRCRAFMRLS